MNKKLEQALIKSAVLAIAAYITTGESEDYEETKTEILCGDDGPKYTLKDWTKELVESIIDDKELGKPLKGHADEIVDLMLADEKIRADIEFEFNEAREICDIYDDEDGEDGEEDDEDEEDEE